MKKLIRMTQDDLHNLIKESVENILLNEVGFGNPEEFLSPEALEAYREREFKKTMFKNANSNKLEVIKNSVSQAINSLTNAQEAIEEIEYFN